MLKEKLSEGIEFLAQRGFNQFASVAVRSLPAEFLDNLKSRRIDLAKFPTLIVVGSGGRAMWEAINNAGPAKEHPVNAFTEATIAAFNEHYLEGRERVVLFPTPPGEPRFSIQTFGHWLGWSHPTPLGLSFQKRFGMWHAYRAAFLTGVQLPETPREPFASPCDTCADKPCVKLCPSGAVGEVKKTLGDFDKKTCFTFRLKENSVCRTRCLARIACPFLKEYQYTHPQMAHHYTHSLGKIKVRFPEYVAAAAAV